jgi:hypothetical protein
VSYESQSEAYARMEAMIKRHAPLLMRVGDPLKPDRPLNRLLGKYRPKIDAPTVAKILRLRKKGMTIGKIARSVRVSYRTTQKYIQTQRRATHES